MEHELDWRYVPDNDNYLISNKGEVMNASTGKMLKPKLNGRSLQVTLHKDGQTFTEGVHNLVARTYLEDVPNYAIRVKHRNDDRTDNRPENLYWE